MLVDPDHVGAALAGLARLAATAAAIPMRMSADARSPAGTTAPSRTCAPSPKRLCASGGADHGSTSRCCVSVPPLTASGRPHESARPQDGIPGLRRATAHREAAVNPRHCLSSHTTTRTPASCTLAIPGKASALVRWWPPLSSGRTHACTDGATTTEASWPGSSGSSTAHGGTPHPPARSYPARDTSP